MELGLKNRVAIITGAAQGLGRAIALALAGEGASVVIADINYQKARAVLKEVDGLTDGNLAVKVNVARQADLDKLVSKTIQKFGRIDILINNAGICPRTGFEDITEKEWDTVLAVNLKSVFLLSQKILPYMKKKRYGKIVSLASVAGKIGGAQVGAHYAASKAGIICLTKSIAAAAGGFGINVNAVAPGVIGTDMTMCISAEKIKKYKRMIPLGKIGTPEDVARTVLFLASDVSDYLTGEIIDVNGGLVMD